MREQHFSAFQIHFKAANRHGRKQVAIMIHVMISIGITSFVVRTDFSGGERAIVDSQFVNAAGK